MRPLGISALPRHWPLGRAVLVLNLALGLAACGSIDKDRRQNQLRVNTVGYETAIRWGAFESAMGYLHPDRRANLVIPEHYARLRFTGYDVVYPAASDGSEVATQVVLIDYLFDDRQVVKRVMDRQTWRWDPDQRTWWLDSDPPQFQ